MSIWSRMSCRRLPVSIVVLWAWGGKARLAPVNDILISIERQLAMDSTGQMVSSILSKKVATPVQRATLVAPYLCYFLQDKPFNPGEVISQPVIDHRWLSCLIMRLQLMRICTA